MDQISLGYNFFHITSVQTLGKYKSLYSLGDYLSLSDEIFNNNEGELTEIEKYEILQNLVKEIDDNGAGMIVDIVLSHCSSINPLLLSCKNAAYTVTNTPHLNAAYILDSSLSELSEQIMNKNSVYYKSNRIENENDLENIMNIIKTVIKDLKLHEFFQMNTEHVMNSFVSSEPEENTQEKIEEDHLNYLTLNGLRKYLKHFCLQNQGEERFNMKFSEKLI